MNEPKGIEMNPILNELIENNSIPIEWSQIISADIEVNQLKLCFK